MMEEKDNELSSINSMLDESRVTYHSSQSESSVHLEKITQQLQEKTRELSRLEEV
jgi:hypothetical protein